MTRDRIASRSERTVRFPNRLGGKPSGISQMMVTSLPWSAGALSESEWGALALPFVSILRQAPDLLVQGLHHLAPEGASWRAFWLLLPHTVCFASSSRVPAGNFKAIIHAA